MTRRIAWGAAAGAVAAACADIAAIAVTMASAPYGEDLMGRLTAMTWVFLGLMAAALVLIFAGRDG